MHFRKLKRQMHFLRGCILKHAIAIAVILAFSGTAFASGDPEQTSLRTHAARELEMAVSAVDEAARKKALWIPAETALDDARAAFARGDLEQAGNLARTARRFAELGIKQLATPPYRHYQ